MNYYEANGATYRKADDGDELIANFTAEITAETKYTDGANTTTMLTIIGTDSEGQSYPEITISADKFQSMQWPLSLWGSTAIIPPSGSAREHLRTHIQLKSKPERRVVYQHTGWTMNGEPTYLHGGGGIKATGNDPNVRVEMPTDLRHFELQDAPSPEALKQAVLATLHILHVAPGPITWPLLAGCFAPCLGGIDFGMHLTGRTGTRKSELVSLFQSHYGSKMDARKLPCSWSSTGNALEAQTYRTKDALVVVDDFVPNGTRYQTMLLNKTADQLFRALGNQAGRARLTDSSQMQETMYPRGLVLSTGEDTPDGHSCRGRMLTLELTPQDVSLKELTKAQGLRRLYPQTTAGFLKWLAPKIGNPDWSRYIEEKTNTYRDQLLGIGHARTPSIMGRLLTSLELFLNFAEDAGAIDVLQAGKGFEQGRKAIMDAGKRQEEFLASVDPCEQFIGAIRHLLSAYLAHVDGRNGGIPLKPELLGWTEERSAGQMPTYKSHGKLLGWIDWDEDLLLIDAGPGYELIAAKAKISFTKITMLKRLKEGGQLVKFNSNDQRNTIRVTCGGNIRTVLAFSAAEVLQTKEKPHGDE